MKKLSLSLLGSALMLLFTMQAHAQNDTTFGACVNSPENPTAVLAVVGSAGAFFFARRKK